MPEGPEVTINVDYIKSIVGQFTLKDVQVLGGRYKKNISTLKNYDKFIKSLPSKCKTFSNKGKFIYIILENNWSIWITYGMSGHLTQEDKKHNNIQFIMENSNDNFYFNDVRNFGTIQFHENLDELDKKLKTLGTDPLREPKNTKYFIDKIRKMNQTKVISEVLMDQKVYSGVGNYIRAEVLYRSKINPFLTLAELTDEQLKIIVDNIYFILKRAYDDEKNGTTYKFEIYGQKEDYYGNPVHRKEQPRIKRTIHWVPAVQN